MDSKPHARSSGPLNNTTSIGDVFEVTVGDCSDIYCLDIGLYDTAKYGAVYILNTERPAVVDTGTGVNYDLLRKALDTVGITPSDLEIIALTHVHLDHAGGAGLLAADCPNAEVYVHEIGAPHVIDPSQLVAGTKHVIGDLWGYHIEPEPVPETRIRTLGDGDTIDLGDRELETLYAPGHAPHQVAFYDRASDALFPGDAAGMWLPCPELLAVTTPPPNFDLERWLDTHETIRDVDAGTFLYPHFGPREAGNVIDEHERLLMTWVRDIEMKREELDDEAVIEYFLETSELSKSLGDPAGSVPAQFSVLGILLYLDIPV
jgi:glyoxylase-like metal-dependent hydrolase (beta-lactamase superfamily II)